MFKTIKINKEINIIVEPWKEVSPKSILNSWCNLFPTRFNKIVIFLLETQNKGVKKIKIKKELIQFIDKLKLDEGSNAENKFVIMFNLIIF